MNVNLERDYRNICWGILGAATVLRVIWAILITAVPVSDGEAYDLLAHTLIERGVYGWSAGQPSAFWPPGTSAVYAVLYYIFGYGLTSIVLFNIACSTAIVGLTIWLGQVFFDRTTALLAGALMAIWPSEVAYVTILASELPFTVLVLLGVAAWFKTSWSKLARAIFSGLLFGAATYFRSVALLLPIVLWLTAVTDWQKLRRQLPMMFLTMIVVISTVAPWTFRNYKVFDHVELLTSSDGVNLWMGNNPDATGFYMTTPADTAGLSEYDQNKILGERAKQYIIGRPVAFILRTIKKAVLLHAGETIAVHWNAQGIQQRFGERALLPIKAIMEGFWLTALLLALIGIAVLARDRGIISAFTHPVVLIWAYYTVIYGVILVVDRFHFPSHPFISILAAIATLAIIMRARRKPLAMQA